MWSALSRQNGSFISLRAAELRRVTLWTISTHALLYGAYAWSKYIHSTYRSREYVAIFEILIKFENLNQPLKCNITLYYNIIHIMHIMLSRA